MAKSNPPSSSREQPPDSSPLWLDALNKKGPPRGSSVPGLMLLLALPLFILSLSFFCMMPLDFDLTPTHYPIHFFVSSTITAKLNENFNNSSFRFFFFFLLFLPFPLSILCLLFLIISCF
jgi:hypothetical protein